MWLGKSFERRVVDVRLEQRPIVNGNPDDRFRAVSFQPQFGRMTPLTSLPPSLRLSQCPDRKRLPSRRRERLPRIPDALRRV